MACSCRSPARNLPTATGLILNQQPVVARQAPSGEAPPEVAPAAPGVGRRPSLFDLGIYAGGAWTSDWFDDGGIGFEGQQQDEFAIRAAESIRLLDLRGFVEFGDPRGPVRITFRYADGSEASSVEFPAGQGQYGGVYTAPSPSGTSGVQLQLFGMDADMRVDVSEYSAAARVPLFTIFPESIRSGPFELRPSFDTQAEIEFERSEREDAGSIDAESGSFFFRQQRRQSLDENRFSVGLAGEWFLPVGRRLQLRLRGLAGAYYRDAEFDSFEQLSSNVVAVPDRDFTIALHDQDDGFGFRGELGSELRFSISPGMSLFLGGSARYLSDVGAIYTPRSSTELLTEGRTAGIVVTDAWQWRAGAGLIIHFGPDRSQ